jgi:hypothetical protein
MQISFFSSFQKFFCSFFFFEKKRKEEKKRYANRESKRAKFFTKLQKKHKNKKIDNI